MKKEKNIITNQEIKTSIRACVNSYNGEYGKVDKKIFGKWESYESGHVEWSFASCGKTLYIVFRGSDGTSDWIDNFKFWHRTIPYKEKGTNKKIKIHTGFYEQYSNVRLQIIERMYTELFGTVCYTPRFKKFIITGHSLGGALATLCALDIEYNYHQWLDVYALDLFCITFGSPRVGNKAFANSFDKRFEKGASYRIVNGDDIVSKVPPAIIFYRHIKNKKRVGKRLWYNFFSGSVGDHYPQGYQKSLERIK